MSQENVEFVLEVQLDRNWACIYRGSGELDPSGFRVADLITSDFGLRWRALSTRRFG